MRSTYCLEAKKTVKVVVRGEGCGFQYHTSVGSVDVQQIAPNLARIFLPGEGKGVVISWNGFPSLFFGFPMTLGAQGKLKNGGDFHVAHAEEFRAWLESLRARFLDSYVALVRVRSAGGHNSPLAGKVKIRLAGGREIVRVVPASQVQEVGGKLYIPLWLAKESAMALLAEDERELPHDLVSALSKLEQEFERRLAEMHAAAMSFQEAERLDAPIRAVQEEAERAERLEAEREAQQRAAERQKQKMQQEKKKAEKLSSLPIHATNVTVRGQDWSRRGGQYTKEEWIIEDATIKISGTRAYIFKENEDQPIFFKPLKNIEIVARTTAL